ncbi:ATP-binding protein [Achromobacter xylosoxidans]
MDEALTNIVSDAFDDPLLARDPVRVNLACRQVDEWASLEITDNGRPHDPTKTPPASLAATLDDAAIGGHGVRLMQHYLRSTCDGDRNRLTRVMRAA